MTPSQENPAPGLSSREAALWDAAVVLLERNQSFIPKEASASPAFVRVVKTPPQGEIMDTCKQTFSVEQLTTEAAGPLFPGQGHMGAGRHSSTCGQETPSRSKLCPRPHQRHQGE